MFNFYISIFIINAIILYEKLFAAFFKYDVAKRYVSCSSNQNILGKVAFFEFLLFHLCI